MTNPDAANDLHRLYEGIYAKDKNEHFLKYRDGRVISDSHAGALQWFQERSIRLSTVLDFGCGEADFLGQLPAGDRRIGLDYSQNALDNARKKYPSLELILGSDDALDPFSESMDVVCSFGTLEHMDNPWETLGKLLSATKSGGFVVVSCPSFLNVRGVIWMALVQLWDVPMSLSDRHFLTIQDFREKVPTLGATLVDTFSVDLAISQGADFGRDMRKRLTNALRDAKLDNRNVERTVQWFERNLPDFSAGPLSGTETVYVIQKE